MKRFWEITLAIACINAVIVFTWADNSTIRRTLQFVVSITSLMILWFNFTRKKNG